jgi:hypothetical protein
MVQFSWQAYARYRAVGWAMLERNRLAANCSLIIPTVMSELNLILSSKPEDVAQHVVTANQLLKSLLEQTERAVIERTPGRPQYKSRSCHPNIRDW